MSTLNSIVFLYGDKICYYTSMNGINSSGEAFFYNGLDIKRCRVDNTIQYPTGELSVKMQTSNGSEDRSFSLMIINGNPSMIRFNSTLCPIIAYM